MSTGVLHLPTNSCVGLRDQQGTSTTSDHLQTALCVGQFCCYSIRYKYSIVALGENKIFRTNQKIVSVIFQCVQPSSSFTNWYRRVDNKVVCVCVPCPPLIFFILLLLCVVYCPRALVKCWNWNGHAATPPTCESRCQKTTTTHLKKNSPVSSS